jgi:hypothetical protein
MYAHDGAYMVLVRSYIIASNPLLRRGLGRLIREKRLIRENTSLYALPYKFVSEPMLYCLFKYIACIYTY